MKWKVLLTSILGIALPLISMAQEVSLQEIGPLLSEISEIVLKIEAGDELPLEFNIGGDIISLKSNPENGVITALQPLYIKVEPNFLFSMDNKKWHSFETLFTGNLSVSVPSSDENLNPSGKISFEVYER